MPTLGFTRAANDHKSVLNGLRHSSFQYRRKHHVLAVGTRMTMTKNFEIRKRTWNIAIGVQINRLVRGIIHLFLQLWTS